MWHIICHDSAAFLVELLSPMSHSNFRYHATFSMGFHSVDSAVHPLPFPKTTNPRNTYETSRNFRVSVGARDTVSANHRPRLTTNSGYLQIRRQCFIGLLPSSGQLSKNRCVLDSCTCPCPPAPPIYQTPSISFAAAHFAEPYGTIIALLPFGCVHFLPQFSAAL